MSPSNFAHALIVAISLSALVPFALAEAPMLVAIPTLSEPAAPPQNTDPKAKPGFGTLIKLGESIAKDLSRLTANDASEAVDGFFPRAPFLILKKVPKPAEYFEMLMSEYRSQLKRVARDLKLSSPIEYLDFRGGFCKWKPVDSEYNKIAYWSCYNSPLTLKMGEKKAIIKVRTVINWGEDWFVTHLGKKAEWISSK